MCATGSGRMKKAAQKKQPSGNTIGVMTKITWKKPVQVHEQGSAKKLWSAFSKEKLVGFFATLPVSTIAEIKRRSGPGKPQWQVIADAIRITGLKQKPAKVAKKKARK